MSSPKRTRPMVRPSTPPNNHNEAKGRGGMDQGAPSQNHHSSQPNVHDEYTALVNEYEIPGSAKGTSFSPSKARAQAKATQQTTVLKTWLANLLPPQTSPEHGKATLNRLHPLISRWENEYVSLQQQPLPAYPTAATEILKALQDLMYANQAADSHRKLLHEARKEELDRLITEAEENADVIHTSLSGLLHDELSRALSHDAETSLTSIAEMAFMLGVIPRSVATTPIDSTVINEVSASLIEHSSTSLELSATVSAVRSLILTLESQLQTARNDLAELEQKVAKSNGAAETLQTQTSQWQREMKQISLKIQEYNDRIAVLARTQPGTAGNDTILVEDVVEIQYRVQDRKNVIAELEERIKMFNGLPADLEASRKEVQRAKNELATLKGRREELFGEMASSKGRVK